MTTTLPRIHTTVRMNTCSGRQFRVLARTTSSIRTEQYDPSDTVMTTLSVVWLVMSILIFNRDTALANAATVNI